MYPSQAALEASDWGTAFSGAGVTGIICLHLLDKASARARGWLATWTRLKIAELKMDIKWYGQSDWYRLILDYFHSEERVVIKRFGRKGWLHACLTKKGKKKQLYRHESEREQKQMWFVRCKPYHLQRKRDLDEGWQHQDPNPEPPGY